MMAASNVQQYQYKASHAVVDFYVRFKACVKTYESPHFKQTTKLTYLLIFVEKNLSQAKHF